MYRDMSKETQEFFDFMLENELFDVLGRKTKRAGGYMTYLPDYHAPFVFANFNGTSGDLDVITHECGHAFQGYVAGKDPIEEHWDITMETAEIHSMSMEFFADRYMELFLKEDADRYRRMHLEDAAAFIPYGCMVDEFQHIVYEHPELTRRSAGLSGESSSGCTSHIWIMKEIHFSRMEASGRSSSTFTTLRSTILIMYWHRPVHLCTRSGWRRIVRRRGRAICGFVSFLHVNSIQICCIR